MDVELILNKLESMQLIRTKKRVGNYMTCYCPFHNNGNESKPSCGVLLTDEYKGSSHYPAGLWHCFACGYAHTMTEAIDDLLKIHHIDQSGMDWLKANIPGFENDSNFESLLPIDMLNSVESQYAVEYLNNLQNPKPAYVSEAELASYRYTVPYMYERKLTDEIINKFDVGFDAHFKPNKGSKKEIPCITFPVRDIDGNTLFFCRRSIEGKYYNYPEGVIKPVYGIDMISKDCKSVIICESIINCLTCWVYGYPAVALMGTGNSYQMGQLQRLGVHEYVLCFDGDGAGKRATDKFYKALSKYAIVWRMNMIEGEDVNSIDRSQFEQIYKERY